MLVHGNISLKRLIKNVEPKTFFQKGKSQDIAKYPEKRIVDI